MVARLRSRVSVRTRAKPHLDSSWVVGRAGRYILLVDGIQPAGPQMTLLA